MLFAHELIKLKEHIPVKQGSDYFNKSTFKHYKKQHFWILDIKK